MQPPAYLQQLSQRPPGGETSRRVRMTLSCRDCDAVPKVEHAGEVLPESPWPVQIMHNGVRVARDGYDGPWMTDIIRKLRGHHEPQEELVFHEVLKGLGQASLMVELGAYWAYYSLWFRQQYPQARSVLVEPDPNNMAIGQYNFHLNGREGTFVRAFVGREPHEAQPCRLESNGVVETIPQVSVDALVKDLGLGTIDLLLADIQGAELEMLQGMEATIARGGLRRLFVSTHDECISGDFALHEKCLQWIKDHGGRIIAEHTVYESYSGDGLIVASFGPEPVAEVPLSHLRPRDSLFGDPVMQASAWKARSLALEEALKAERRQSTVLNRHLTRCSRLLARDVNEGERGWLARLPGTSAWRRRRAAQVLASDSRDMLRKLRREKKTEILSTEFAAVEVLKGGKGKAASCQESLQGWMAEIEAVTGLSLQKSTMVEVTSGEAAWGLLCLGAERVQRCLGLLTGQAEQALLWSNIRLNGFRNRFLTLPTAVPPGAAPPPFDQALAEVPPGWLEDTRLCWLEARGWEDGVIPWASKVAAERGWVLVLSLPGEAVSEPAQGQTRPAGSLAPGLTRFRRLGVGEAEGWQPLSELDKLPATRGTLRLLVAGE